MEESEKAMLPERGHCALLEAHAALRGTPVAAEQGFAWTAPASSWGKSCHSVRLARGPEADALDAKMRELGCTAVSGPDDSRGGPGQEETERFLSEAGFILVREAAGMIIGARDVSLAPLPAGHGIEEPADAEALLAWSGIVTRCLFESADPRYAESFAESASLLRAAGMMDLFLCRAPDGSPVAASAAFMAGGALGGVYFVATEPSARKRGIGGAITSAASLRCAERGVDPVVLHATDIGKPVYERLGFRRISTMRRWKPRATAS